MLNFQLSVAVLIVVCSVWVATAIPWFQMMIPNGEKVPNPCTLETSDIWERVGHKIRDKDNDTELIKNRFGEDFKLALTDSNSDPEGRGPWYFLCMMDSDGDLRSNGVELGDPDCSWSLGQDNPSGLLTHPGIPDNADGTMDEKLKAEFCY